MSDDTRVKFYLLPYMTASSLSDVVIRHIDNCRGIEQKTRNSISCASVDIVHNCKGKVREKEGIGC